MMEASSLVAKEGNGLPNGWMPAKFGDSCEITRGTSLRG